MHGSWCLKLQIDGAGLFQVQDADAAGVLGVVLGAR